MKKNTLTLILLSLILVANTSCKTDDKDNNEEESVLTSTNYVYEGDLRRFYLTTEITRLNEDIETWSQILIGYPEYEEAQANIQEALAQIETNELEISNIESPTDAFFIIKPILPPIPVPSPCICFDLYNSIQNIVLMPGTDQLNLSIISNTDESTIVDTTDNSPIVIIPNTQNTGRYQPFTFEQEGFTGEALIMVQSDNDSYSVHVNFQKL